MMMTQGKGCRKPQRDIRDFKVCATPYMQFAKEYALKMPRVKNQEQTNSCCAFATSTILEYYNKVNLSTEFLYGIERSFCGDEDEGMYMADACKIVNQLGDMIEQDCPGNHEVPIASILAEDAAKDSKKMERAKQYTIENYYRCNTEKDIKFAISTYGPVLACIFWDDTYDISLDGVVTFGTGHEITNEGGIPTNGGYHAVVIYGWTEKGWLIQNSWGKDFGFNGRFILPYEYEIADARILIEESNKEKKAGLFKKSTKKNIFVRLINKILN